MKPSIVIAGKIGKHQQDRIIDPKGLCPALTAGSHLNAGWMNLIFEIMKVGNIYPSEGQNGNIYTICDTAPAILSGIGQTGNGIGSNNAPKIIDQIKPTNNMGKIYRIRKLTERECFRLMGCTDADIDRIQRYPYVLNEQSEWVLPEGMDEKTAKKLNISGSQQYKMAGNSIVVQCLEGIFCNMFRKDEYHHDTLF